MFVAIVVLRAGSDGVCPCASVYVGSSPREREGRIRTFFRFPFVAAAPHDGEGEGPTHLSQRVASQGPVPPPLSLGRSQAAPPLSLPMPRHHQKWQGQVLDGVASELTATVSWLVSSMWRAKCQRDLSASHTGPSHCLLVGGPSHPEGDAPHGDRHDCERL